MNFDPNSLYSIVDTFNRQPKTSALFLIVSEVRDQLFPECHVGSGCNAACIVFDDYVIKFIPVGTLEYDNAKDFLERADIEGYLKTEEVYEDEEFLIIQQEAVDIPCDSDELRAYVKVIDYFYAEYYDLCDEFSWEEDNEMPVIFKHLLLHKVFKEFKDDTHTIFDFSNRVLTSALRHITHFCDYLGDCHVDNIGYNKDGDIVFFDPRYIF